MPPRWLQHPVTVFLIPLVTFLALPNLYKLLPYVADPSYDETRLQRVASLMDDIYTTLADSTFIPHNAITRGPHVINQTALPCTPSASVLRLMELLPYVDLSLVDEPDWIHGGHFMDYRNTEHLAELCDPCRGRSFDWTDYMSPNDIALTNWGTGGWNNDRTWVMIYDTARDAIRIFDAELWVTRWGAEREFGKEMDSWWFEDDGELWWDRDDGASHILRAIANNYKTLERTPWATSNRENGFGASPEIIKNLLLRNGWLATFDRDQFNADFIRGKHKPSGKGHAEAALRDIDSIAGFNRSIFSPIEDGWTDWDADVGEWWYAQDRLKRHRQQLAEAADPEERQVQEWHIQHTIWHLKDLQDRLDIARAGVARLCPDDVCVKEEDLILWEFVALQRTYEEAYHTNISQLCEHRLHYTPSDDPDWLAKCVENEKSERLWLDLAYHHSEAEALAHCKKTGSQLLTFKTVFDRARDEIAGLEKTIVDGDAGLERLETAYKDKLPDLKEKARILYAADESALINRRWYIRDQIEILQEEIAKLERGEGKERERKWLFDYLRGDEK
ncbi:hypothetical protein N0V87_009728 [Didymella glomerata]|jgi:hypothetical protein|uniref:Uncharacterized protein n=1 Tax=Didymella glomerata TaxID=749621 RepID=A0A9W9BWN4_9PLEO|nr:hypothetical protein N0V87_009728 [Didymella glomerata]